MYCSELLLCKSQEKIGFSHCRISNYDDFRHVVISIHLGNYFYSFQFQNLFIWKFYSPDYKLGLDCFEYQRFFVIKYFNMSYFREQNQTLQLQNAQNFIKDLSMLQFFIRNVPLQVPTLNKTSILNEVAKQMQKSFNLHNTKVLKLWINFIQRANNQYLGITSLHLTLLLILTKQQHYKMALKIVEYPGLPVNISIRNYKKYLILSSEVYHEFERHSDALECLSLATSIEDQNFEESFMALKVMVLTNKLLENHFDKKDFQKEMTTIKICCQQQLQQMEHVAPQKMKELCFEYGIFVSICQDKQLQNQELHYLKTKQLFDLYQKTQSKKIRQLKNYIIHQIAGFAQYRIKQAEIGQIPLHSFKVVKDVNKIRPIYKSDPKNKIMYFHHHYSNQANLDSVISKACVMEKIIRNRPIGTKHEENIRQQEERFGRIGGMMDNILGFSRR